MQGLPFLSFVGEYTSTQQDPAAWLKAGESSLRAWWTAEQELQAERESRPPPAQAGLVSIGRASMQDCIPQEDGLEGRCFRLWLCSL